MAEKWSNLGATTFRQKPDDKANRDQVELIIVSSGHQIFGLLMAQVNNIMRPGASGLQVLASPAPPTRVYGEILYQHRPIRVLELSRQLALPLVEPIERSKILLVGPTADSNLVFGVAVDDIVLLRPFPMNALRLLPRWLCGGKISKLVWGAVLVEPQSILLEGGLTSALPTPFQFEVKETVGPLESLLPIKADVPAMLAKPALSLAERLAQRERRIESQAVDNRRPLVLLDLQPLYKVAFSAAE